MKMYKNKLLKVTVVAISVAAALPLAADTETVNGIEWSYTVIGDYAEISKNFNESAIPSSTAGAITIPSKLGGYPVKSIGWYAFYKCSALTSVTIPDSIINIGGNAFSYCSGLTSVTMPYSVTSIGSFAFSDCSSLVSVTIPVGVTSIADILFYNCGSLSSVTIPEGVTSIGNQAFYGCSSLRNLTIPDSVASIGGSAFAYCSGLTNLTIPDSVTSIGKGAFTGCRGLSDANGLVIIRNVLYGYFGSATVVTIPNGITNIEAAAFNYCSSLANITIPDSVTVIGDYAFIGCSGLRNVTIPDSVTVMGESVFVSCSDSIYDTTTISGVKLVDGWAVEGSTTLSGDLDLTGVRGIAGGTFCYCGSLLAVSMSDSVRSIGRRAFAYCSGLKNITIPDSVTNIGEWAFDGCRSLTNIAIPNSVTSIGDHAFYDCRGLKEVTLPQSACTIGMASVFSSGVYQSITNVIICDGVTSVGGAAFASCSGLKNVTIPDSVTSIGDLALSNCSGLTNITIPDSVTSIGDQAFSNCSGLTNITIPDSVTNIGKYAFYDCSALTSVTIPDSITCIKEWTFSGCSSLTNIIIPNSVITIGNNAFSGCSSLTNIIIPNSVITIGNNAFYGCNGLREVAVPQCACTNRLTSIFPWGVYQSITRVVVLDGVTRIGDNVFDSLSDLKDMTIPNSVTSISSTAFRYCGAAIFDTTTIPGFKLVDGWVVGTTGALSSDLDLTGVRGIADSVLSECVGLERISASIMLGDLLANALSDRFDNIEIIWTDAKTGGDAAWALNRETFLSSPVGWESGAVANNQQSWFEIDVDHPGLLSFWWKASSESDGADIYDYAYLSVDGDAKGSLSDYRLGGIAIGGKTDWVNIVIDVDGAGPHTIRWTYCKDDVDEADTGDDCVWLDDIVWTPKVSVSYDISDASGVAPNGVAMLAGTTLTLPGAAGFSWTDHVFDGWSDGKNTYLPGETYEVPRTDVTFAAQWIRKSALTFALNGGSGTAPMTIKEVPGTKVTLPLATGLSRAKHTFAGWSDGATTYHEGAEYVIGDQDAAFTAVWTANTLAAPVISSADVSNGGTIEAACATIAMSAEMGAEIRYTMDGSVPTAASPRYTEPFVADGMDVTINAIAVRGNYFDSNVATFSFTRKPYSLSECLGMDGATVTTGGDSAWGRILGGEAYDGVAALKSGTLDNSQTNWVQMTVSGPGTVSFWWNVSSEGTNRGKRRDGCVFSVDGVEKAWSDGTTNVWTQKTFEVSEPGVHTLKWAYGKDGNGTFAGADCAWLAEVVWTQGVDPSVPHWSIAYENLKGVENPNPSKYYEGYGVTFQPLPDISGYTFAGWIPGSISADETGDKVVTANWNWIPQDAVVEASITGGKALTVDAEWVKTELDQVFGAGRQQLFVDKFGDDFAAALAKKTGKRDGAGNELAVWHDYIAGTDPTDVNSIFKAKIEIKDGMPVVEWEPNLNSNGETRVYTVYGKAKLADAWHSPANALDHFFKVDVAMLQDGTVTFNVGGGSSVDTRVVRVGQPIGDLPTPTRQGYDFIGWFTESEGGSEITSETIVTDDMTIFAQWEKRVVADLVHRWSFNGNLTDSIGGQTATKVGNVTVGANQYTLAGGFNGSSYINLGSNVLPNDGSPVTLEIWATHLSNCMYSRMFTVMQSLTNPEFNGGSDEFSLCWDSDADVICRIANWHVYNYIQPYDCGVEYHISAVFTPLANGNWQVVFRKKNSSTGATIASYTQTFSQSDWTLQIQPQTYCMLGHVNGDSAGDANASYNELRIWKKEMTEEELTASAIAGPDADL